MIRLLASAALKLIANAVGLAVAAAVLDDMSLDGAAYILAVLIFTVVEVIAEPLLRQVAVRNVHALMGSIALVTTLVGLIITSLISDGLSIEGVGTWLLATVIVWAVALVAGILLPLVLFKQVLQERDSERA